MKHLLQHFKTLTKHPQNAEELKGLILQLAIQGKLTENWREENPSVESASELLERIKAEKLNLIAQNKIKKEKSLQPIEDHEKPYELPKGWVWCRLRDIGFTQTGSTPPKKDPSNYGDFIPFLGPADISNQSMKYPKDGLSQKGLQKGRLIPKNSILMVCIGGSIGKCNITEQDVSCNQQINIITPILNESVFIKTALQSPYFQNLVWEKSTGSATPIINKGKWEKIIIPLPPLKEQKAIVALVNELFKEVEQLEDLTKTRIQLKEDFVTSALQRLTETDNVSKEWFFLQTYFTEFFTEKANVKQLRDSILQLAVQGKLTTKWRSQNPNTEPASELLKRIQTEKQALITQKKIKKEKPLPSIEDHEKPYELPEGWVWCRFQDIIIDIRGGGTPSKRNPLFWDGNLPWASVKDLKDFRYLEKTQDFITEAGLNGSSANLIPANSLIICTRMGLGKIAINKIDVTINQDLKAVRLTNLTEIEFIYDQYKTKTILGSGMTVSGIKQDELLAFLFAIPPLEEQKAIVEQVQSLMALCDSLEEQIQNSQTQIEQLMQSSLRAVFEEGLEKK